MREMLRPGMRLMRRLRVAGKFIAIPSLLLVPLSILTADTVSSATRQITVTTRERDGLVLARPLTVLVTRLCQARIGVLSGSRPGERERLLADLDAADGQVGTELGVHEQWLRLRVQVTALFGAPGAGQAGPAGSAAAGATGDGAPTARQVTKLATAMLARVADASGLIHDPHLDSYYVMISLVDRLPSIMQAAADAAERASSGPPTAREGEAVTRSLTELSGRLGVDLRSASEGTDWQGLDGQLRPAVSSVQSALADYNLTLIRGGAGLQARPDAGTGLALATADLTDALSTVLDLLLVRHQGRLEGERDRPLLLALLALTAAGYLFVSLYRATTGDVRQVLADINSLTTGVPNQTQPLAGPDEFGQMSRAVVAARDRLTSLLGTLRYQGTHDELTSLANRALFTEKLTEALAGPDRPICVVVIDLDGFKDVNDSFGHVIGDRLLRTIGARFHRAVRRGDLVARLGADQFAVLLVDASNEDQTAETVESLQLALDKPVDVDGRRLRARASVGIARRGDGGDTASELMRNADIAMHLAKRSGPGQVATFEPAMHEATRARTELSYELVQGFEQGQLHVVYQPIVNLDTQTVYGVEALARWQHPTRGSISPTVFVPLAEATGLIIPIGRWVLREAVHQLVSWHRQFPDAPPLTMDVNLSADQLNDPELVGDVLSLISETGIDPAWLVLEITESALVRNLDSALHRLGQLRAMGVRLALDDFGTGYSSLSYLRRLPVTVLKIDKSFVTDSDDAIGPAIGPAVPGSGAVLLRSIVELGTGLGMQIVAEGIQNHDQLNRLRGAGCTLGQGFLWSQPVSAEGIGAVLARGGRFDPLPRPRLPDPERVATDRVDSP